MLFVGLITIYAAEQFVNDALNIETPSFKDDENLKHEFVGRLFEDSEQIETQPMDDAVSIIELITH
jgi:hypothetical protein